MTRRFAVKGDETIAFRVPGHIAAWLRERAIVLTARAQRENPKASNVTPSSIMREILESQVSGEQECKQLPPFANISKQDLEAAEKALELVRMMKAGLNGRRQRRAS